VITISRPVINRLPVDVNQLDEFACRQLDKVCSYQAYSLTTFYTRLLISSQDLITLNYSSIVIAIRLSMKVKAPLSIQIKKKPDNNQWSKLMDRR
jgi:hypothetical protein